MNLLCERSKFANTALAALALLGILFLASCTSNTSANSAAPAGRGGRGGRGDAGPVPVVVTKVDQRDVPIDVQVIGNVEAYSTISVKSQVSGQILQVRFHEGDFVKKGEVLFEIDPRPYEAQVSQAEANIAHDSASLQQAQANLARDIANEKYAREQASRYNTLFQQGVMSKDQTDQLQANADALAQAVNADKAAIESAKAQIGASKAALENAKVQLSYTKIVSPIDGRTGNLTVKQGNVVPANTTELVTINQVEPIYVTFAVPESYLGDIKRYMARGKMQVFATPQDDASQHESGVLTFIDNAVDMTTGTIKLKGTFPNTDRRLWPGQYVKVSLRLTTQPNALILPNQAVQTGQDGTFVYVVKGDRTVEFRPVVTGPRVDQNLVIEKGVHPGETVVLEGQLRLSPGSRVMLPGDRPGGRGNRGGGRSGGPGGAGSGQAGETGGPSTVPLPGRGAPPA